MSSHSLSIRSVRAITNVLRKKAVAILSAAALTFFMLAGYAYSASDPRAIVGIVKYDKPERAPDFTLMDTRGKKVSLGDFRGKALFVTFWATW